MHTFNQGDQSTNSLLTLGFDLVLADYSVTDPLVTNQNYYVTAGAALSNATYVWVALEEITTLVTETVNHDMYRLLLSLIPDSTESG